MFDKSKIVNHLTHSVENAIKCEDSDDKKLLLQFLAGNGFRVTRFDWPATHPYVWIDSEGRVNCDETNTQSRVIDFADVYDDTAEFRKATSVEFVILFA